MRKGVVCVLLVAALAASCSATLRVNDFRVTLSLEETGRFHVEEQITVTFFTPHHGIEREIPVSYRVPAVGTTTTIDLDVLETALDGKSVPTLSKRSGRNRYLRLGDPDRTLVGTYTYTIAYAVDRALLFHDDYLQLYWNVTGTEWRIPIDRVTATVVLPSGVDRTQVSSTSYSGYYGSATRAGAGTLDEAGHLLFTAGNLSPGEGLTIDLAIPRDQLPISAPSLAQRALWFVRANLWAGLPVLALILMLFLWIKTGRDPRTGIIAPAFAPPSGMHPGEAGVLIDDRIDLRDISAMIVGLAVSGHLTIEEVARETPGLLDNVKQALGRPSSTPADYRFVRTERHSGGLSTVEQLVLDALFESDETERTLSSLENSFYKNLPAIRSRLYTGLIDKGYYPHNPERTRRFYLNAGGLLIAGGIAFGATIASLYVGAAVAISGAIVLVFSRWMPRKTRKGVRALEDVLGLSEYIRRAEVDRIEFHNAPEKSPELFEKLLPYAIALNLTSIWTHQFEGLLTEPPTWYVGSAATFHGPWFALSMLHLSRGMERTLATAPRTATSGRSAWGGGSSFGGGFSGGGFGGGGGGGW